MTKKDCFYGIYPIKFVWNGPWNDPELKFKGHTFNYWDVENRFYEEWCMKYKNTNPYFEKWISNNGKMVKEFLNAVIEIRKETK